MRGKFTGMHVRAYESINTECGIGTRKICSCYGTKRIRTRLELTSDNHTSGGDFKVVDSVIRDLLPVDDDPVITLNE